jgi:hypothetical protein
MSTTVRWGLAIAAIGVMGLGLLLVGVALGRATGGTAGYEPVNATQSTFGPTSAGSSSAETLAPERSSAGVDGGFGPDAIGAGAMDGNSGSAMVGPGGMDGSLDPDTMGPSQVDGNLTPDMMGPGGVDDNFGSGTIGQGMMSGISGRGMMGR